MVIHLLTNLESEIKAKVWKLKVHEEFTVWCKTQSYDLAFDMETGSKDKVDMEASLVQLEGTSEISQNSFADYSKSARGRSTFSEITDLFSEGECNF